MKKIIVLCLCMLMLSLTLTACGNNGTNNSTDNSTSTDNNSSTNATSEEGLIDDIGNDVGNAIDDVGNAVDDVANGVGDALTGGFNTYDDAYNHFMNQLPSGNKNYEVRNSDKDLTEYTQGRQGYHFELHNSALNENSKIGDFYLDVETGKIYHSENNGEVFTEFDFSNLQ